MKVFPQGPIALGTMAALELGEVKSSPEGKTARYRVRSKDPMAFTATFSGAGPRMGVRYEPVRGALWGALDVPEDRDEVHLVVGCPKRYGMSMAQARSELQPKASSVFPESSVRALLRGILDREGQR
jgi:hypothetical protein